MNTILRLGVYDSPGALDRIAGLIRRNGLNITSVNAGTFKNGTAQISIVLTDARADVNKLGKQLYDINFVADYKVLGAENACIRELALIRMKASDFDGEHFKGARILEDGPDEISFEITGLPQEIDSLLQSAQGKVLDVVRSGALAIQKGGNGLH
ncbi:MAG: ACT domain-containing protein [Clostridiales bacterium]|jgi:acetolactate synthase small subunit|nr:ACT domain-containing protein [Clostridiales bacterium]